MIERLSIRRWLVLAIILSLVAAPAWAQALETLTIGYVEIAGDGRYEPMRGTEGMVLATRDRPFPAAEVALDEARPLQPILHRAFALTRITLETAQEVAPAVLAAMRERNVHFFVLDLPAEAIAVLAFAVKGEDILLLNASAADDALRRQTCAVELVHVGPSLAMLSDAQAEYMAFRKWRDALVLRGPLPGDAIVADAFIHAAKKFGIRITVDVPFAIGSDPRERERNDIGLLTATSRDYDVVFAADTDPDLEFARSLPYRTTRPRPVVGAVGLTAESWHPAWERYGAPQLNNRFLAKAGRPMTGRDWPVWMAAKLVIAAAQRARGGGFRDIAARILTDPSFDGVKGLAVSVRPWDHQLRQAVLLTTHDSVAASAPLPGFLHATNELDTLGDDRPETPCHLDTP